MILTRKLCEEAIGLDPNYEAPHSLLGSTHLIDLWFYWGESPQASLKKAVSPLEKAVVLSPASDFAHALLGILYLLQERHDEAVKAGERSIELNPNGDMNMVLLGIAFNYVRRYEEAIALFKEGQRRNPYCPAWYIHNAGWSYLYLARYDEAIAEPKKALEREPDHFPAMVTLASIYGNAGKLDEGRVLAKRILKIDPKFSLESVAAWPYKHKSDSEVAMDGLRKVGIPDKPPLPFPDKPSLAVLPFTNMSGDPKQEYLSDGITESIITAVSKIHNLFVIARNSTFAYKSKAVNIQQVARELGVQYVLEGSVQRSGDRLRITAQLIDALNGRHMWTQKYDRDLKDLFAVQDDITMEILRAMRVKFSEGQQVLRAKRPKNIESAMKAYEAQGCVLVFTPEANVMGRKLAEEVIAMEPDWGEGYYILSQAHMMEVWLGTSKSPKESLDKAIALSEKAVSLDDSLSQAYAHIGYLYGMKREHDKSVAYTEKAVEMDPNGADARAWLANCLRWAAR